MTQGIGVRLTALGPNRLKIMALAHPFSAMPPNKFRAAIDSGPIIVVEDWGWTRATRLAEQLKNLGAVVELFVSTNDCD